MELAWLTCTLDTGIFLINTYQDDGWFGLQCAQPLLAKQKDYDPSYFKIHHHLNLPTGLIESVILTLDTAPQNDGSDAVLAEMVLTVEGTVIPIIAAERDEPSHEWRRLDESVVVLRDLETLNRINWLPPSPHIPVLNQLES